MGAPALRGRPDDIHACDEIPEPDLNDVDSMEDFFHAVRWPEGICCPSCGSGGAYRLSLTTVQRRRYKCKACRRQFSVTKGTILEGSKLSLADWVRTLRLLCATPDGLTITELQRELKVSYAAAQNALDRIDYARRREPLRTLLAGDTP